MKVEELLELVTVLSIVGRVQNAQSEYLDEMLVIKILAKDANVELTSAAWLHRAASSDQRERV